MDIVYQLFDKNTVIFPCYSLSLSTNGSKFTSKSIMTLLIISPGIHHVLKISYTLVQDLYFLSLVTLDEVSGLTDLLRSEKSCAHSLLYPEVNSKNSWWQFLR